QIAAPARVDAPGHVVDILPTLLDVAGAAYPAEYDGRSVQPLEGRSLLPLFVPGGTRPDAVYGWEHEGNRAVRDGDWKLVSRHGGSWELFNLADDRLEASDLAATMPDRVAAMTAQYED